MTIVGLYPTEASDQPTKVAFYLPIDPANVNDNIKFYVTPFESGDAETLLTFVHDFKELICLKGANGDYTQQVQTVRLLLREEALEYVDPVITPVDPTAAHDTQEAVCQQNQDNRQVSFENGIQGLLERTLLKRSRMSYDASKNHTICPSKRFSNK
jgi:hypothetical protein